MGNVLNTAASSASGAHRNSERSDSGSERREEVGIEDERRFAVSPEVSRIDNGDVHADESEEVQQPTLPTEVEFDVGVDDRSTWGSQGGSVSEHSHSLDLEFVGRSLALTHMIAMHEDAIVGRMRSLLEADTNNASLLEVVARMKSISGLTLEMQESLTQEYSHLGERSLAELDNTAKATAADYLSLRWDRAGDREEQRGHAREPPPRVPEEAEAGENGGDDGEGGEHGVPNDEVPVEAEDAPNGGEAGADDGALDNGAEDEANADNAAALEPNNEEPNNEALGNVEGNNEGGDPVDDEGAEEDFDAPHIGEGLNPRGGIAGEARSEPLDTLASCDDLSARLNASGDRSLIAAKTLAARTIQHAIINIFDPRNPKLHLLLPLAEDAMNLVGLQAKYSKMLSSRHASYAKKLASVTDFNIGDANGWSDILIAMETTAYEAENVANEPPEVTAALEKLKAAISEIGERSTGPGMKTFLCAGTTVDRTMVHLLHLCIWFVIISEKTLYMVYHLVDPDGALLQSARDLAALVDPSFQLDEATTLLAYIQGILFRGLVSEHWRKAATVLCDIKKYMTAAEGERIPIIHDDFSRGQWHMGEGTRADYCGGTGKSKQRNQITVLAFGLAAEAAVLRCMGGDAAMFSKRGGYGRSLLRLSPRLVYDECKIFVDSDFYEGNAPRSEDVKAIRKEVVDEPRLGDRAFAAGDLNVIIESEAQIGSLRRISAMGSGEAE
ncbi:hypothetical protein ACHAXT_010935 [Thalassiosira profunda]